MARSETRKDSTEAAARTHPGAQRPHNEDAVVQFSAAGLWCVADGMGGHEAGDVASAAVVDSLGALAPPAGLPPALEQVDETLEAVNDRLRAWSAAELQGRTLGTTVAATLVRGALGACLWAGDSRLYLWRQGGLRQLTRDHTEVQKLVDNGVLEPHEADSHPWAHVLSSALGAQAEVAAETLVFTLEPGDQLLLCSDGLYNEVRADEMEAILARAATADEGARELLDQALARDARDNVSVIVVRPDVPAGSGHLAGDPDAINAALRDLNGRYAAGTLERAELRRLRHELLTGTGDVPDPDEEEEPTGRHPVPGAGRQRVLLVGLGAAVLVVAALAWLL